MESLELERPFACSVCQESFAKSKALAEHVKVVHLLKAPENIKKIRDVCPKEKKNEDSVLKELRVVLERIDKPNCRSIDGTIDIAKTTKGFRYLENKSKRKEAFINYVSKWAGAISAFYYYYFCFLNMQKCFLLQ